MSTNRPFLSNFFAAFRAHTALQKVATTGATSTTSASSQSSYVHTSASNNTSQAVNSAINSSAARNINNKTNSHNAGPTTAAVHAAGQFQSTRQHAPQPYSRSPGTPPSPGFPVSSPSSRGRRGSDSSSEGFREPLGAEKWYIGGRTAAGEEKFYRLGMVKRPSSMDRLSLDRLSI